MLMRVGWQLMIAVGTVILVGLLNYVPALALGRMDVW